MSINFLSRELDEICLNPEDGRTTIRNLNTDWVTIINELLCVPSLAHKIKVQEDHSRKYKKDPRRITHIGTLKLSGQGVPIDYLYRVPHDTEILSIVFLRQLLKKKYEMHINKDYCPYVFNSIQNCLQ